MKDAWPGSHRPKKPLKKKIILGYSQLSLLVALGSCPLPTHTPGEKQLESHLVLWLQLMGWALCFLLEATVAIYSPWAEPIGPVLAVLELKGFAFGILCFWQWCRRMLIRIFKKADLLRNAMHSSVPQHVYTCSQASSEMLQPHSASWLIFKYRECHES